MKNYLLVCLLAFFSVSFAFAQERTVSGRVTDSETGEPLPGVNVMIQGTTMGSVTDLDGIYETEIPEDAVLMFSYVGYKTQLVEVGNLSQINVALEPDVTALSEVVVVGYGTQEKKEITSAVASVKEEDFNQGNVQQVAQLVQGKVPGLSITKTGGNPNDDYDIRLRGLPSIGANTQPLVVIDGIVGGAISSVDPSDIESIDVLKDGSAAAIYGTRGSSGVILITTKSGREGQFDIDYNGFVSASDPARLIPMMTSEEWRSLSQELGAGIDFQNSTNWMEEITRVAFSQTHNVSLSGGSKQTTYRASFNYRDEQGIAINTGRQQLNGRFNLTQKALNDKLTATFNFAGTYRDADIGFANAAFEYATIFNPTAPVMVDETTPLPPSYQDFDFSIWDGFFNQVQFNYYNPVQILEQNVNETITQTLIVAGKLQYEFIDGLFADVFYSLQSEGRSNGQYYDKNSYWQGADDNGRARRQFDQNWNQLFEMTGRWNGDIGGRTNLGALLGYSYQEFVNQGYHAEGGDFITDAFGYNNLGAAKQFDDGLGDVGSYKNSSKLIAFFARVNFNIDETYFLSASVRQEGASRFGEENKWGTFPAISGGVELANFLGSASIDNLKLRVSYGVTGNLPGSDYISLQRFGRTGNFFYNGEFIPAYGPVSNANPNLAWERKGEFDIGVDFSFLGSRLYGSFDYYDRKTTDLIIGFGVPVPPNLFGESQINVGDIKNSGLELGLFWNAVVNPSFSYTPGITASWYLKNDIISLSGQDEFGNEYSYGVNDIANMGAPGQNDTPLIRVEEGKPLGQIWGLIYEGIAPNGDWQHADLNGNGTRDNGDRTVIGSGIPDFDLGFNNSFTFGQNWDLNIFFRGSFGHDLVNSFRGFYEIPQYVANYNVYNTARDLKNEETGTYMNSTQGIFSDLYVEDASFFKLDNWNLGYNFGFGENSSVRKLRLWIGGNNTFVITGYKGADPEVRWEDQEGGALAPGIDRRNTWFLARSWTFGLQFGL